MVSNKTVSVNLLGCLPLVVGLLIMGVLGFCGSTCQDMVQDGIRSTANAFKGQ